MGAGFFQIGADHLNSPIYQQSYVMTRSDLVEELAARFSQLTHRDAELADAIEAFGAGEDE